MAIILVIKPSTNNATCEVTKCTWGEHIWHTLQFGGGVVHQLQKRRPEDGYTWSLWDIDYCMRFIVIIIITELKQKHFWETQVNWKCKRFAFLSMKKHINLKKCSRCLSHWLWFQHKMVVSRNNYLLYLYSLLSNGQRPK